MKATSMTSRSGQRTASSDAVVLLHGHQLERNLARAVTAEAAGTFVLVLAITSADARWTPCLRTSRFPGARRRAGGRLRGR